MYTLKEVLEAKNLAVIGASQDPMKPGSMLLKVLKDTGFQGQIAGVNPRQGEMYGVSFYRTVQEIPFPVDLAVLIIPPRAVVSVLADCARAGVKGVVISSEGFAETGSEGARYQQEVGDILRSSGMRGFGPNTMGIVNTATGMTTAYFSNDRMLRPGSIGFAAQSGIFVGALLRYISSFEELRISKALGLGNKVDVDESDVLAYFREDKQTEIVGLYLEDIRDGRRFLEEARRTVQQKPVLLMKGGRTAPGARASASHTASLAIDDKVLDGALRQAGVLRVENIDQLMAALMGFRCMPLPKGGRIALVTFSGAQAIMSLDIATDEGLSLARFANKTREMIAKVISSRSKSMNPVDIFPDMMVHGFEKTCTEILRALLTDDGVDGIIFISFAMPDVEPYRPLVEVIQENLKKPVFFSLIGEKGEMEGCRVFLERNRIPMFLLPEMGVKVFSHMWRYARIAK